MRCRLRYISFNNPVLHGWRCALPFTDHCPFPRRILHRIVRDVHVQPARPTRDRRAYRRITTGHSDSRTTTNTSITLAYST